MWCEKNSRGRKDLCSQLKNVFIKIKNLKSVLESNAQTKYNNLVSNGYDCDVKKKTITRTQDREKKKKEKTKRQADTKAEEATGTAGRSRYTRSFSPSF